MAEHVNADEVTHLLREIKERMDGFDIAQKCTNDHIKEINKRLTRIDLRNAHARSPCDIPEMRLLNENSFNDETNTTVSSSSEDTRMRLTDRKTNCMAGAFQRNIERIVHCIPFEIIQDRIVQRDLVTTIESDQLSKPPNDHTKVRRIVLTIMDKSLSAMERFLELIGECDPSVRESIQNAFESAIEDDNSDTAECTACLLKRRINIEDISDSLFSQEVISRELYIAIIVNDLPAYKLWKLIFVALLWLPRTFELEALERAISDDEGLNNNEDILQHVKRDFARNRRSGHCRCAQSIDLVVDNASINSDSTVTSAQSMDMSEVNRVTPGSNKLTAKQIATTICEIL